MADEHHSEMLPVCQSAIRRLEDTVDELDKIIRGSNGEGITTKIRLMQDKVDAIYKLMWFSVTSIVGLIIVQVVSKLWTP